jgi:DNA-binding transcriptional regulator LsrR (DeoR family)
MTHFSKNENETRMSIELTVADNEETVADIKVRAAWMYYIEGLTQEQIAQELETSRIKVNRLLSSARSEGIVRIRIDAKSAAQVSLERQLCAAYGLKTVIVVPTPSDVTNLPSVIGFAAGVWLSDMMQDGVSLAVGWGSTLNMAMRGITPRKLEGASVISLLGGMTHSRAVNPSAVARRMADVFGADCYQLTAPVFVSGQHVRDALRQEPTLQDLIHRARSAHVAMFSVGDLSPASTLFHEGLLPETELESLRKAGAVGDVLCHFIDAEGRRVDHPVNQRTMAVELSDLRTIRDVAIASGGAHKALAIRAAILATQARVLITDQDAAKALLEFSPFHHNSVN